MATQMAMFRCSFFCRWIVGFVWLSTDHSRFCRYHLNVAVVFNSADSFWFNKNHSGKNWTQNGAYSMLLIAVLKNLNIARKKRDNLNRIVTISVTGIEWNRQYCSIWPWNWYVSGLYNSSNWSRITKFGLVIRWNTLKCFFFLDDFCWHFQNFSKNFFRLWSVKLWNMDQMIPKLFRIVLGLV